MDRGNILTEVNAGGDLVARNLRGLGLVARENAAGELSYYLSNAHGDITTLVNGAGEVLNSYQYDAFGNTTNYAEQVINRFRYAGEQFDNLTGEYYLRARYYNPQDGRFTQEDTYRGDGLNLYTYVDNNPIMYTDPSGHVKCSTDTSSKNKITLSKDEVLVLSLPQLEDFLYSDLKALDELQKASNKLLSEKGLSWDQKMIAYYINMQVRQDRLHEKITSIGETGYYIGKIKLFNQFTPDGRVYLTKDDLEWGELMGYSFEFMLIDAVAGSVHGSINNLQNPQVMNLRTGLANGGTSKINLNQKPNVSNEKLKNIINDLYKGQGGPNTIGNGTTMDAVRNEIKTGLPTHGKFHTQKLNDYSNALQRRLRAGDLNDYDKVIVNALIEDINNALKGQ